MAKIPAKASKLDIVIEQGASFSTTLTWLDSEGVPVDLTGYSALLEGKDSSGAVVVTWTDTDVITLGGVLGTIAIDVDDSVTATYAFDELTYCLVLTDTLSFATRLLKGSIILDAEC